MLIFTDPATSLFIGFFTNGAASLINAGLVSSFLRSTGSSLTYLPERQQGLGDRQDQPTVCPVGLMVARLHLGLPYSVWPRLYDDQPTMQ